MGAWFSSSDDDDDRDAPASSSEYQRLWDDDVPPRRPAWDDDDVSRLRQGSLGSADMQRRINDGVINVMRTLGLGADLRIEERIKARAGITAEDRRLHARRLKQRALQSVYRDRGPSPLPL